ncbi:MAG: TolC family protein, partial [Candidatus Cloacimonetes bacterium]|nr:TolC family protein [Candidatus Cloacimonadota bacterium]
NTIDSKNAGLNVSKSLQLIDPTFFNIKTSKIAAKNSQIMLQETKKNVTIAIFNKYISVLQIAANLKIAENNYTIQQQVYDVSKIKHQLGNLSDYDLQTSEVNLITQEIQVKELENNYKEIRQALFSYINMEDDGAELQEPEITVSIPKIENYENNNIMMKMNNLRTQKISLFQQKLNLYPMPVISASYNNSATNDIFEADNYEDNVSFGLNVSYDLFDIPTLRNNFVNSQRDLLASELNLRDAIRENKSNIETTLLKIEALESTFELYKKKLKIAGNNLDKAKEQYELGLISITEFERARVDLFSAEITKNNKYYSLLLKQEELNLLLSNNILGKY